MSDKPAYYFTDVFAEGKYEGNQLATFIHCASFSDKRMQQIAREINFSETTFILSGQKDNGGYDVRIFTPGAEVDFAGHPTLGTAHVIKKYVMREEADQVLLNLKIGQIPVNFSEDGTVWMKQMKPEFGQNISTGMIADVLGLKTEDIDSQWPVQEVSTGLPQTIVPLKSLDALKRCNVDLMKYRSFIEKYEGKVILTFSPESYNEEQQLSVRVFPICFGIPEDPATGSGNGCLAAYLVKHRYFGSSSIQVSVGQGYEIGRPSTLYLNASEKEFIEVFVGGKVQDVAKGEWQTD